jgi:hypothetical protein
MAATVSDPTKVQLVAFWINGLRIATVTAAPYSAIWNVSTAPKGLNTVLVKVVDKAGNFTLKSVTVTVK